MWPIPEIIGVICCCKIFGICRAWNRRSSHDEGVACYLGRKVPGHWMPKKIFCTNQGSVWPIPEIMRLICWHQIFGIFRAWTRMSSDGEQVACYLVQKEPGHRMPKNICALIIFSVWPIPEIMRVIHCRQIFFIFWERMIMSSHEEWLAGYLGQKGHGHRMPKKHFCTKWGQCVKITWNYESDPLRSDFWHKQSLEHDEFA